MRVVSSASEMQKISDEARREGKRIGFVPTMGALHEGHLALFQDAKNRSDLLVVSIFVNPAQFNDKNDYEKYPRDQEGDLKKCQTEKVDIVFTPTKEEIYPAGEESCSIPLPEVALPLEGGSRPGHFEGVIHVVSRLFRIVCPHLAIFGMKDYQQLRVIEEMTKSQKMDVEIIPHSIERSPEGLALSSRNARLSEEGRKKALVLFHALQKAQSLFQQGERNIGILKKGIKEEIKESAMKMDYIALVDAGSLLKIKTIERPVLVALAGFMEGVRLIDNCILDPTQVEKK